MQTQNLNLVPVGMPPIIYASRYDAGRQFQLNVYDGMSTFTIDTSCTVIYHGTKPDKKSFAYSSADDDPKVTFDGSTVTVTTTDQMTAIPGDVLCEIVVYSGENRIGTLNFILHVEEGAMPEDADLSASDLTLFYNAEQNVTKSAEDLKEAAADLAIIKQYMESFNSATSYTEDVTILASGWQGTEAPYTYTIDNVSDDNVAVLQINAPSITVDQLEELINAYIVGSGSNIIYAYGKKPTLDIPLSLYYLKVDATKLTS